MTTGMEGSRSEFIEAWIAACPNVVEHYPEPSGLGYGGWFEWADEMIKTHRQRKCQGCGLYLIWVPR